MKHPFAGVIAPVLNSDSQTVDPAVSTPTRRGLFALFAGALAVGTVGLVGTVTEAEATTFFGEGGRRRRSQRATTLALGEEGRGPRRMRGRGPTTLAFGEEGRGPRRMRGRGPTTLALGEEGRGRRTTMFFGEQGRRRRRWGMKK